MMQRDDRADIDLLVQRFIDQELSAEERLAFVARLGSDERLRNRVMALEHIAASASRLPRSDVPPGFVAGVVRRLESERSVSRPWFDVFTMPRAFEWGAAGVLAMVLAAFVTGGIVGRYSAPVAGPAPIGTVAGAVDDSQTTPVSVRLVVVQPGAQSVEAAGDFNGWDPAQTPLERISEDAWAVTLALEPGRYQYLFVVDGERWVMDPFATDQADDGFGSRNAVLEVRAPQASSL